MTPQEKTDLLSGFGMWKTAALERFGIPTTTMTDGTYGVRYSIPQIDGDEKGGEDLDAFLNMVNQRASDVAVAWGEMKPATCFPNGSAMGNSWDTGLMRELGELLGRECRAMGVHMLLGPGINIRRTPLAGRSYEYYSEDPVVTGKLSAAVIEGIQEQGVGTSLKHFACNNSEIERTSMDSVVEERALREIYLKGFEIAIKQANPWTVMSSYNRLNGVQASQDPWLLGDVLRGDWGYEGIVVSDWHGIKDRPASLLAGGDLDMPESPRRKAQLLEAIENGSLPADVVDRSCVRMLEFIAKALAGAETPAPQIDQAAHHARARAMGTQSMVLVKNGGALPVRADAKRVLVMGRDAETPVIQGSGCATTIPTMIDSPVDELRSVLPGAEIIQRTEADAEAMEIAKTADVILAYVSTEGAYDGEGSDRTTLALGPGQDEMIRALAASGTPVAVIVACPDAIEMPWIDAVDAVLVSFYSGQAMAGAVADLVSGKVSPSGKLSVTFPQQLSDVPGHLSYPGELGRHMYSEGVHVGYRGYAARGMAPLFAFGHGLSYTSFAYSDLSVSTSEITLDGALEVSFTVTNTGDFAGREVSQIYLAAKGRQLKRSTIELKAFAKTPLEPGESRRVTLTVTGRDLAVWHPGQGRWVLEGEEAELLVAAASDDIRLRAPLTLMPSLLPWRRVAYDTQPAYVLPNPHARGVIRDFLSARCGITADEADRALEHCANSFFGIFTTLERRLRISITEEETTEVIARINAAMDAAEAAL
ncbi:glycosyl hydrolase [Yangia sp. PrR002]|nr:glycosyl hydrolase [Salipiger sp. PrR002]NDW59037.1 glycosyl hydrolase [Salipiger sp. PrR004]